MAYGGNLEQVRNVAIDPVEDEDISKIDEDFGSRVRIGVRNPLEKPTMKERVRLEVYKEAILNNRHLFMGKTVLHLGCGIGILSLVVAEAGAARIIGVDDSDIIHTARNVIREKNLDGVITLIQGNIEEVELPKDIHEVDIVLSEWMGGRIFYEGMLDSILFARYQWLKPGGLLFPDKVTLYLVGLEAIRLKERRVDFWENVWGKDMSVLGRVASRKPYRVDVHPEKVVTNTTQLIALDLKSMKKEDANFSVPFSLKVTQKDYLNAFGTFYEVQFTATHTGAQLSTSPNEPATNWIQTVFLTDEVIPVHVGEIVKGYFKLRQNRRHEGKLDIRIKVGFNGSISEMHENNVYKMP